MKSNNMKKGVLFALLTALVSGFSIFFSKIFIAKMDPIVYTTLKNISVAVILSSIVFTSNMRKKITSLSKNEWKKLILIGIIGGSIPFALFFTGLKISTSINAALIHKTLFVWVALLAVPFLGEKINPYQVLGYITVLFGVFFGTNLSLHMGKGETMILTATILWAIENIIAKKALSTIPSQIVAWARLSFGSVVLFAMVALQGKLQLLISISNEQIIALGVATVFLTLYVLTWYTALSYAPATLVSSILILSTPVTAFLSGAFLTSSLPPTFIIQTVGIGIGLFLIISYAQKAGSSLK